MKKGRCGVVELKRMFSEVQQVDDTFRFHDWSNIRHGALIGNTSERNKDIQRREEFVEGFQGLAVTG